MKTIVLATDGSPSAARATATAVELATETGAPLHVVTAWSIPASAFGYAPVSIVPEVAEAERAAAAQAAAAAVAAAEEAGVDVTSEVREGIAVEEICTAAAEARARLVVIGAHGWGPLKRLVFGSVSTGVLQHAPCPVLVVRGGEPAETVQATQEATASSSSR